MFASTADSQVFETQLLCQNTDTNVTRVAQLECSVNEEVKTQMLATVTAGVKETFLGGESADYLHLFAGDINNPDITVEQNPLAVLPVLFNRKAGYATALPITETLQFATKQYVDSNTGSSASSITNPINANSKLTAN